MSAARIDCNRVSLNPARHPSIAPWWPAARRSRFEYARRCVWHVPVPVPVFAPSFPDPALKDPCSTSLASLFRAAGNSLASHCHHAEFCGGFVVRTLKTHGFPCKFPVLGPEQGSGGTASTTTHPPDEPLISYPYGSPRDFRGLGGYGGVGTSREHGYRSGNAPRGGVCSAGVFRVRS